MRLTVGQLEAIEAALDLYSRVGMGQLKEAVRVLIEGRLDTMPAERRRAMVEVTEALTTAQILIEKLEHSMFKPDVLSISDRGIADKFRVAYDIQQTLRYHRYLNRCAQDPGYASHRAGFVDSGPPLRYSASERTLPTMKVVPSGEAK